jgi:hypothetical protein
MSSKRIKRQKQQQALAVTAGVVEGMTLGLQFVLLVHTAASVIGEKRAAIKARKSAVEKAQAYLATEAEAQQQ